jgi:hypothetical protein
MFSYLLLAYYFSLLLQGIRVVSMHLVVYAMKLCVVFLIVRVEECETIVI